MKIVIYTPGELTRVLVRDYRDPKRASEDFICSWFINRNEQMDWVCHSGQVKHEPITRICIMTGKGEHIPDEAIEVLCQLLVRLIEHMPEPWPIQFGSTPRHDYIDSNTYASKELKQVESRILQNLKLMKVSLAI